MTTEPQTPPPAAEPAPDPLAEAGREIVPPDVTAADEVRERFAADGTSDALGRLADLALWWAQVRADAAAPSPARVAAVGAAPTVPLPDGVRRMPLTPPEDADAAVTWGLELADGLADSGTDLALLAADTRLVGRALAGYLLGLDPVDTNGWQTGPDLDDDTWMREVETVRDLQWALRGLRRRPIAMVRALPEPRVAASAAFLLGCARRRTPVVLDGPGAAASALLAMRCSRPATQWWLAAEIGEAPLHERTCTSLGLAAVTRLGLRVEDGTASAAALPLLTLATGLLDG